ncbi:double zinc ribbon domain-containing protein [Klebsiella pneumoniae]
MCFAQTALRSRTCPKCGQATPPESKFCDNCRQDLR